MVHLPDLKAVQINGVALEVHEMTPDFMGCGFSLVEVSTC